MLLSKILLALATAGFAATFPLSNTAASGSDLSTDIANAIANSANAGRHTAPMKRATYSFLNWQAVDIGSVFSVSSGSMSSNAKSGTYKVVTGDTGSKIATKLGVSVTSLSNANPRVNWGNLFVGQAISIPGSSSVPGNADNASGQILETIANQLGISSSSLSAANPNLDWYNLAAGQQLNVPQENGSVDKFTLMFGDMGQTIASTFGISYAKLIAANPDIDFNSLQPGQKVMVPASVKQMIDPDDDNEEPDVDVNNGGDTGNENESDGSSDNTDESENSGDSTENNSSDDASSDNGENSNDGGEDSSSSDDAAEDGDNSKEGEDGETSYGDTEENQDNGEYQAANEYDANNDNGSDAEAESYSDDNGESSENYVDNSTSYEDNGDENTYSTDVKRVRRGLHQREPTTYMVEEGETIEEVAIILGVAERYLEEANPGVDFDNLEAGQILQIPIASAFHTPDE